MYVINPKENAPVVMPYTCGDYILAEAKSHANPSDWIKKQPRYCEAVFNTPVVMPYACGNYMHAEA